jgi:hypothetical protein
MDTLTRLTKIEQLANLIEKQTRERYIKDGFNPEMHNHKVSIKPGKRYIKVDVGSSGKYMVDAEGNIFGIKAYGVIHLGHQYGTLDTIKEWNWGGYTAFKANQSTTGDK